MSDVLNPVPGVKRLRATPAFQANLQLDQFARERRAALPDPAAEASRLIRQHARQRWHVDLDPDQTLLVNLHYHQQAGGECIGQVMAEQTLTQALLANEQGGNHFLERLFPRTFQRAPAITRVEKLPQVLRNPLDLQATSPGHIDYYGVYRRVTPMRYGPHTQLNIDPQLFQQFVWDTDFHTPYAARQAAYWRAHARDCRDLLKCALLKAADLQWHEGTLRWADRALVWRAAGLDPWQRWQQLTVEQIQATSAPGADCAVASLRIHGYTATDLMLFSDLAFARVVLYVPGNAAPLHGFAELELMQAWLARQARVPALRQALASHFELRDRPDGLSYSGLETALLGVSKYPHGHQLSPDRPGFTVSGVWNPQHFIVAGQALGTDIFEHLRDLQRQRAANDAELLIRSDATLIKQRWRQVVESALNVAGALALAFPELEVLVELLALAEALEGAQQLLEQGAPGERAEGLGRLAFGVLNAAPLAARGVRKVLAPVPRAPLVTSLPEPVLAPSSPVVPVPEPATLAERVPVPVPAARGETALAPINRLSPAQAGSIRSHALADISLAGRTPNALGIYQIGEYDFYVRYTDPQGFQGIYAIRSDFKLRDETVVLIDPLSRKSLGITLRRGKALRLPGAGLNPHWDPAWEVYLDGSGQPPASTSADLLPAAADALEPEPAPVANADSDEEMSGSESDTGSVTSGEEYSAYDDSELRTDNPDTSRLTPPPGSYFNRRGMLERRDFQVLFRVEQKARVTRRGSPLDVGFRSSNFFGGVSKMLDGEVLIVSRTRAGAEAYGASEFGHGEFECYMIDAQGVPAVSYMENLEHNGDFTRLREPPESDTHGGVTFDEVHLSNASLDRRRIRYA